MKISGCSFNDLSYSALFKTYLNDHPSLKSFYAYDPKSTDVISQRSNNLKKAGSLKQDYLKALQSYHQELGIGDDQKSAIERLSNDNALVMVTGQQLGIYGGPLFTIYKTMSAIILARKAEKELNRPVIPVFWMADEDHDFEEIAWTGIYGRKDYHKVVFDEQGNEIPVSEEKITEAINALKDEINEHLFETDFSAALWEKLDQYYSTGKTHAEAFARLINDWFSEHGVLIAGSQTPQIKKLLSTAFYKSIDQADVLHDHIEQKSLELEKRYHRQVHNGDTNLFYLDDNGRRLKIQSSDTDSWEAGSNTWDHIELLDLIERKPEHFSPNVFLRPVIQDLLLPTIGYVAGPGELAYYGQMKDLYQAFNLEMPIIYPRMSATLVESGIARIMEKLPFEFSEYDQRIEDLESEFIERTETVDIESVFSSWKSAIDKSSDEPLKVIKEIDPTLEGTVGKTVAGFSNELDKLKGRVYRSVKKQESIQINRIEKIKVHLFPDGGLQERSVSPINFLNKYGLDLWSELLLALEEQDIDLYQHLIIEL